MFHIESNSRLGTMLVAVAEIPTKGSRGNKTDIGGIWTHANEDNGLNVAP